MTVDVIYFNIKKYNGTSSVDYMQNQFSIKILLLIINDVKILFVLQFQKLDKNTNLTKKPNRKHVRHLTLPIF
jgi:hypothetical protein